MNIAIEPDAAKSTVSVHVDRSAGGHSPVAVAGVINKKACHSVSA